MIFCVFELCFPIGAIYCAVHVGHELRHFCKTTAVTFILSFSSAIVLFVKLKLSGGPLANTKPVVKSGFYNYTERVTQSVSNFGAELKV